MVVALVDDAADLVVDLDGRVLAVVLVLRDLAAEEDLLFLLAEGERAQRSLMPHSQTILRARSVALLDVVAGAGGHRAEDQLLREPAAHQDRDVGLAGSSRV